MTLSRRTVLHLTAAAPLMVPRLARAQAYPTRPVRLIVGLPPASAPDIVARLIGQWLAERLGQSFIIDNRPGAATNIATEDVVRAPPDGYTLLLITAGNAINAARYKNLNFDFIRDIAPVGSLGRTPFVVVVNPSVPANTMPELIAYAKANPGKLNMASPGVGGTNHIFGELFQLMTGVRMVHVPYRDSLFPDLLGGQVQVYFGAIPGVIAAIKSGRLRALAVTTASRVAALPDVPTMVEFVPGYEASGWLGMGAPAKTPGDIVDALGEQCDAFDGDPTIKAKLLDIGVEPMVMGAAQFRQFMTDETAKWAKVVEFANVKDD